MATLFLRRLGFGRGANCAAVAIVLAWTRSHAEVLVPIMGGQTPAKSMNGNLGRRLASRRRPLERKKERTDMDLRLAGKRALVTGSSAGLGEAIAKFLAAEGVTVVAHGRDVGRTNAVAHAIRATGGRAEIAIGDRQAAE